MEAKKYKTRGRRVDYKAANDIILPVAKKRSRPKKSELYPVEVVERDAQSKRVKLHYTGYGSSDDEWRDEDDIVQPRQDPTHLITATFNLYQELALKIKMILQSTRRSNPEVRIVMDFDRVQFDGGIKQAGTLKSRNRVEKYTIKNYSDLDEFLGSKWYIRGLNSRGDFCYAILKTVCFYLSRKRPLVDFYPEDQHCKKNIYHRGYSLVFTFVREDGVSSNFRNVYMMS